MSKSARKFSFRNIVYQEDDGSFTGVCLDLDIVEQGHVTIDEAMLSINDAVQLHMWTAEELDFPKELISRPAPQKYWSILARVCKPKIASKMTLPFQFFTTEPFPLHVAYA